MTSARYLTKLYFYSFAANYEDQIALGKTPQLKIGETTQESAAVRIHQQMGTATAQKPTIYGEFEVPFTDKQFHTFLRSRGYSQTDGAGTEWFLITVAEAEALVHEFAAICNGVATPIRKPLDLRPYQTAFVSKFINTEGNFCLFAKCRSGKSVMTLMAALEAGYSSLLVVSYRTSAANSWRNDAATYTAFHEWDVIDLSDSDWERKIAASQKANRKQLMVSTVQRQSERFGYLSGLRAHYPDGVDLLALDECHIGGESGQFKRLLEGLSHGRLLEISGTAYKTIWKYDASNVFVWGYVEEQRAKAEGADWAQSLPRMELVFARYDAGAKASVYGDDPDALKNVFSVEGGKWKDSASVQAFLRQFFAYGAMCRKQEQLLYRSQHIVMSLPSVEACYHFAESLKQFGSQFVPLVITGDSGNNQDAILEHVSSNPSTICLTVYANIVGVTVPEWDTVIHGWECESAEHWVQFAFRGGSTRRDSWRVIDFAPERAVSSIVEMASVTASVEGNEQPDNVLRTFVDFADVFAFNNGFTELDYANLLQFGSVGTTSVKAAINAAVSAVCVGGNLQALAWAFEGLDKLEDRKMLSEVLSENGTDATSNARNAPTRAETDEEKKLLKETLARVKAAVGKLDDVVLHAMLRGVHVSTLPQVLAYSEFESLTGCHPDLFDQAIVDGWINLRVTSNSITQAHTMLDARLTPYL
jgi:hypothetical protein